MNSLALIRPEGIESIVFDASTPKVLVGRTEHSHEPEVTREVAQTLSQLGYNVYTTPFRFPDDLYATNGTNIIGEKDFGDIANNGNYIVGTDFILISSYHAQPIDKVLSAHPHVDFFYEGKTKRFIPPFSGYVSMEAEGVISNLAHLDLTMHYIPELQILSMDAAHYSQTKQLMDAIADEHGFKIALTSSRGDGNASFSNNYISLMHENRVKVLHAVDDDVLEGMGFDYDSIPIQHDLDLHHRKLGGLQCMVNFSPTTKLWDALEIDYKPFNQN